jgi:RNA polymerase sigma-70 factor (ECF subfamily)
MADGSADWDGGDEAECFKALALPHLDEIYTLAHCLLPSSSDADDAVQECYLRAIRHFDTFRGGPIKPWLMMILRGVCRDSYAGNAEVLYPADNEEDSETPEQTVIRRHDSEIIRRLISELPAEFREAIVLREINNLSYRDIATVIEAPIGTVMSRLARGRKMLRDAWIAEDDGSQSE